MARKRISIDNEVEHLFLSRRRCSLCFGLNNDFKIKRGQLAHIDQDNTNAHFDNLVFLCFDHHDEYDSKTSQSKGLRPNELKRYRNNLYAFINTWDANNKEEQSVPQSQDVKNNTFFIYQLINKESVCGYDFLALNETHQVYISISDDHFSINSYYWEVSQWLNCDYKRTSNSFYFDFIELTNFIQNSFFEDNFSLIAYTRKLKDISSIVLTFNQTHKYYELEYTAFKNHLQKVARGFITKIPFSTSKDVDILNYSGLLDILDELKKMKISLINNGL